MRPLLLLLLLLLESFHAVRHAPLVRAIRSPSRRPSGPLMSAADAGEEADDEAPDGDAVTMAQSVLQKPRATVGEEAFAGTTWSMLMQMTEGGSSIFSTQLLEDGSCRFSDSEQLGGWECDRDWVVIEKPKGFFDQTLYFSGKISPPTADKPKWRLVEGVVQRSNATADGQAAGDAVEVEQLGTFGANEFEEALLTTMARFQS